MCRLISIVIHNPSLDKLYTYAILPISAYLISSKALNQLHKAFIAVGWADNLSNNNNYMRIKTNKIHLKYIPKDYSNSWSIFFLLLASIYSVSALIYFAWLVIQPLPDLTTTYYPPRYTFIAEVSAYNVGIASQNDSEPCVGAYGDNLCNLISQGYLIVATNQFPRGTIVSIAGYGDFVVMDKMNRRYTNNFDIAFPADKLNETLAFGRKQLRITIK